MFVKVHTDEGITGIGECRGWPRVIQTAIEDLKRISSAKTRAYRADLAEDAVAMMGHGMTGVVGGGAMTGIEMALWDILGKSVGKPVWDLLGGRSATGPRLRPRQHPGAARWSSSGRGFTTLKCSRLGPGPQGRGMREALGAGRSDDRPARPAVVRGPMRSGRPGAGRVRHPFYEDPVPPENVDGWRGFGGGARAAGGGRAHSTIWGFREFIEREIVDVVQPTWAGPEASSR